MYNYFIDNREVDAETFLYNLSLELDTKLEYEFDDMLDKNDPIMFEAKLYTYSKAFKLLDYDKYLAKLNAYKISKVINKLLQMQKTQGTHIGMYKYQVVKGEN